MKNMGIVTGVLVALVIVTIAAAIAAAIAFGTSPTPAVLAAPEGYRSIDFAALPPVERYVARDGASLGYRRYAPGAKPRAVLVLLHGAADSGPSLDILARALRDAGVVSYVPEMRGHASSGTPGDIAYVGQLDDDLVDLAAVIHQREGDTPTGLIGFSAGGGLALRFASGPQATTFARYLLIAPGLSYRGPTVRPKSTDASGIRAFSVRFVPRLIGLSLANAVGIHAFDGLPVIAFAVPKDSRTLSPSYSMRLLTNLAPADYLRAIAALRQPTAVIVGADDEFSIASEVAKAFGTAHPPVPVQIIPGVPHMGAISRDSAVNAVKVWAILR